MADRPVIAPRLAKDPLKRFPSCTELVRALADAHLSAGTGSSPVAPASAGAEDTVLLIPKMSDTQPFRARKINLVPPVVPGYHLLENVGSSLLSEVWKAQTADGKPRLLKFIYGFTTAGGRTMDDAVLRLKALVSSFPAACKSCSPNRASWCWRSITCRKPYATA